MLYSHIFYFFGKTCTSSCISNRRMGRKGTIVCAHCNSSIFFILGAMNETAFAWISSAVQSSWGRTGPWQGRREGCWSRWERWSPNTPCLYTWNKRLGNYMNNSYYSRRVFFLKLSGLLSRKFQSQIRIQAKWADPKHWACKYIYVDGVSVFIHATNPSSVDILQFFFRRESSLLQM